MDLVRFGKHPHIMRLRHCFPIHIIYVFHRTCSVFAWHMSSEGWFLSERVFTTSYRTWYSSPFNYMLSNGVGALLQYETGARRAKGHISNLWQLLCCEAVGTQCVCGRNELWKRHRCKMFVCSQRQHTGKYNVVHFYERGNAEHSLSMLAVFCYKNGMQSC